MKISKERIFSEIIKIVNLENIKNISLNEEFFEIFNIIFPEFKHVKRLRLVNNIIFEKLIKSDENLILALLLVDETDNHNYFAHKYKISNFLKDYLNFFHTYFYKAKKNKNFFGKDLKKNIFYHKKRNIISLAKFYFAIINPKDFKKINNVIRNINNTKIPEFPLNGQYLLNHGFKSGRKIGDVLKKIEEQWIENDFNLKDEDLNKLIKKYN